MVDAERLTAILQRVVERLRWLDEYADIDAEELLGDRRAMGDLKYTFLTAIEACIDAAMHVVASEQLGTTSTNADAFRRLEEAQLLEPDVAAPMRSAVAFRNLLVHGYAEVDDARVVAHLDDRGVLRSFVSEMAALATA